MTDDVMTSFLVSLGFKVDEGQRKKFFSAIEDASKRFAALAAAAGVAVIGTAAAVEKIANTFANLAYAALRVGQTTAELDALKAAADQVGIGHEAALSSMSAFFEYVRNASGAETVKRWFDLGDFDPNHPLTAMLESATKLSQMYAKGGKDAQLAVTEANAIGMPREMYAIQGQSQKLLDTFKTKLGEKGGLNDIGEKAKQLESDLHKVNDHISNIVAQASGPLITALDDLYKRADAWLQAHKADIIYFGNLAAEYTAKLLGPDNPGSDLIGHIVSVYKQKIHEFNEATSAAAKIQALLKWLADKSITDKIHDALEWAFAPFKWVLQKLQDFGFISPAAASTPEASGAVSGAGTGAAPDGGVAGPHRGQKAILGGKGGMGGTAAGQVPGESSNPVLNAIDAATRGDSKTRQVLRNIYASESGHGDHWDVGDVNDGGAYSPFQFNMGRGRLGDKFQRETGLDPRDPKNLQAIANYTAKYVRAHPGADLTKIWHGLAYPERFGNLTGGYPPSMAVKPATPDHPLAKADAVGFHHALRAIQDFKPPMPWQESHYEDNRAVHSNVKVEVAGGFPVEKTSRPLERPRNADMIRNTSVVAV